MKLSKSNVLLNLDIERNFIFLFFFTIPVYNSINIEKLTINHNLKIKNLGFHNNIVQKKLHSNHFSLQEPKKKEIFRKIYFPTMNKMRCDENKCDYCCINLYQCGSKSKCDYYKYFSNKFRFSYKFFYYLFSLICLIISLFIIYKIADSANKPVHGREDAIDSTNLETFKDLYLKKAQFKENNKNF